MPSIPQSDWDDLHRRIMESPYLEQRLPDLREHDKQQRIDTLYNQHRLQASKEKN